MDILQTLGAAIVFGSTLGATVAGFFAYRQKSLVTVLRESNSDYKERVEQLETERDSMKKDMEFQRHRINQLENEKKLPLENLTALIVNQHTQQLGLLKDISKNLQNNFKEKKR